jgi:hypothetical protein
MRYLMEIATPDGPFRAEGSDERVLLEAIDVVTYWRKYPDQTVQQVAPGLGIEAAFSDILSVELSVEAR